MNWQQVHERISMMLHAVETKRGISERFPRETFTDIMRIIGNFTIFDIDDRFSVEVHCVGDKVMVEFQYNGDEDL